MRGPTLSERSESKGFSLVELLLVVLTVGFLVLLISNIPNSIRLISQAGRESLAREIAGKQIEKKRATPYINLTDGTEILNAASDARLGNLPSGTGQVVTSPCSATICQSGESAKEIEVSISWNEVGKTETIKFNTLISQGGLNQ